MPYDSSHRASHNKKQEVVSGDNFPAKLLVFPRLDLIHVETEAAEIDETLHYLSSIVPQEFETEEAATAFHNEHLATHNRPVYMSSVGQNKGDAFVGQRLSQYHSAPADTWIHLAIDFTMDHPIRCTLGEDWYFQFIEALVSERPSHRTVRRHTNHPDRELLEALYDLEAEVYTQHPSLTMNALRDFWSSFEVHRHLTAHAIKMNRYADQYEVSITRAIDYVRRHVSDYVQDVLSSASAVAVREQSSSVAPNGSRHDAAEPAKSPRRHGPRANMARHRAISAVVRTYSSAWKIEDNLIKICDELDAHAIRVSNAWRNLKPRVQTWNRAFGTYPDRVLKALEYSSQMVSTGSQKPNRQ